MKKLEERYLYTASGGYTSVHPEYTIGHSVFGCNMDAHPALSESPIGFGGYINDTRTWENRNEKEETFDKDSAEYNGISRPEQPIEKQLKDGYNVYYWSVPQQPIVMLMSLRGIQAGEELFVDYGYPYWKRVKDREDERLKNLESEKASKLIAEALEATRDET